MMEKKNENNNEDKMHDHKIRQPLISVMGHVDHGKTRIQDFIRRTTVVDREAGAITQHTGASSVPAIAIKRICDNLLAKYKIELKVPGLLFIDTPGHAAFTNLRKRGGNLADIAILVIDIREGVKMQTIEAVEILKSYKTPFVVAANKVDLIPGWHSNPDRNMAENIQSQKQEVIHFLEAKIYEIVGKLSELGVNSERYDRVDDFTKQVLIVPTCAKTGEGIPELLMFLVGLSQRYLENKIKYHKGNAKGTILEVKEEKGLGVTVDVILYDGSLRVGDTIVIGGIEKATIAKVKALLEPEPLSEISDKKTKFKSVKEVVAAAGIKISSPDFKEIVSGMPLRGVDDDAEARKVAEEIQKDVQSILLKTEKEGILIKADTLGSLEAMEKLLNEEKIPIRKASIGEISKRDVSDAETNYEISPFYAVILGFNVTVSEEVKNHSTRTKIITNNVIYRIIEDYKTWTEEERKRIEAQELDTLVRPCKMQIMHGYVFRESNPAVVGTDILVGKIKTRTPIMNTKGQEISEVKGIQDNKEGISEAESGKQVAISLSNVIVGRQIKEGDILYSAIGEADFRKLKTLKKYLKKDELEVLKEIAEIKRKDHPVWGV